jgi:uncharacterized alkaline shock family protein YloU
MRIRAGREFSARASRAKGRPTIAWTVEGRSTIAPEILASYAADAAREVEGVGGLVESGLHRHRGVRVVENDGRVRVEIHVTVDWGASIPEVGREVQRRVSTYLAQMASIELEGVDVIVDEIGVA